MAMRLYVLNVEELLRDKEGYEGFFESLGSIGVSVDCLEFMTKNRRQLVLLLGPTDTWDEHGPTIYCAIQVCLEGKIPDTPESNEVEIRKAFKNFPQVPYDSLNGVRIVQVFVLPDVPEGEYLSTSLTLLTRYCNGEMAQDVMGEVPHREEKILAPFHKEQEQIHYLGTFTGPSIDDVQRWERHNFSIFFVGQVEEGSSTCVMLLALHDYDTFIGSKYSHCSVVDLFKAFGSIFTRTLGFNRDLDHVLGLRVLRRNIELVQQGNPGNPKKPWMQNQFDEKIIEAFISRTCNAELIDHLIPDVAHSYFGGKLPIKLAEREESVLMLTGLQRKDFGNVKEVMNFGDDNEVVSSLIQTFSTLVDYFNTLSPEVVDH